MHDVYTPDSCCTKKLGIFTKQWPLLQLTILINLQLTEINANLYKQMCFASLPVLYWAEFLVFIKSSDKHVSAHLMLSPSHFNLLEYSSEWYSKKTA